MDSILLSNPWGLHDLESGKFLLDDSNPTCMISGSCSPRIVAPIDLEPRYGPKRKFLPKVSFPFRWDGEICTAFQLPTDPRPSKSVHDFSINVYLSDKTQEITQSDIIGRPSGRHQNELGRRVDSFVEWQVHCFRELVNDESYLNDLERKSRNIVRRSWATVRKIWVHLDRSEPIMALIVKLAQDKDLLRIFNTIVQSPKRILLRYRENTKLSRIQELDSFCIRDYARRPGRNVAEKAGPRQVLLAVQRKSSMETLENRVFSWVLNGMQVRALDYVATNKHHLQFGSNRVRTVERCNRKCNEWLLSENIQSISYDQLHHPIQPNYSLQMDERYRHVYSTYRELLREKKVLDDAWEWQRILWSESARQLVGCALTEFFEEEYTSTPYYRLESENGIWTESPVCPGPFKTSKGTCIVIDSRDVQSNLQNWVEAPPFDFAPYLGNLGCDQALFWPLSKTLLIIWFIYWTGGSEQISSMINEAGSALRLFSSDVRRYTRKPYNCLGLLLITDHQTVDKSPGVDIEIWPLKGEIETVGLRVPFAIDQTHSDEFRKIIEDFKTGIHLIVDKASNYG